MTPFRCDLCGDGIAEARGHCVYGTEGPATICHMSCADNVAFPKTRVALGNLRGRGTAGFLQNFLTGGKRSFSDLTRLIEAIAKVQA